MVDGSALEESALSAEAARSGESARFLSGRDCGAPGARNSLGQAGLFPGERGAGGTPQQPARIPKPDCRRWPSTIRSTIRNCPSCSWISSAASPANRPRPRDSAAKARLTKGPFNALWPVVDLNNALVSAIVTGYAGFTTAAGYVGPNYRVDHDISMLVPEIWCRMRVHERDPEFLIGNGYLERVDDFESRRPHGSGQPAGLSHHRSCLSIVFWDASSKRRTPCFPEEMLRPGEAGSGACSPQAWRRSWKRSAAWR